MFAAALMERLPQKDRFTVRKQHDGARSAPTGIIFGDFKGIMNGLRPGDLSEIDLGTLRFKNARNASVEKKEIVGFQVAVQEALGQRDGIVIRRKVVAVTDVPTGIGEHLVDFLSRLFFRL